jgi:two-component system chemotaxis sensor kinase CheA
LPACLDQIAQWLDATERAGDLPENAQGASRVIVARFARSAGEPSARAPWVRSVSGNWAERLREKYATLGAKARTAIRYAPATDCFYEGVDHSPALRLPGLLAVDVEPASPWPPLEDLDPFTCRSRPFRIDDELACGDRRLDGRRR